MIAIAEHADAEWASWPSIATIARETLLTARSVQRSIDRLIQNGELVKAVKGGRSRDPRYRPNRYVIQHETRRPRHPSTPARHDAHVTPCTDPEVTSDAFRGDICDSRDTTPTSPESKTESTTEPSSIAPASANGHGPGVPNPEIETKVSETLKIIAQRRVAGRQDVRNPTAYMKKVLGQVRAEYEERARRSFEADPSSDPYLLALQLEPVAGNTGLAADENGNLISRTVPMEQSRHPILMAARLEARREREVEERERTQDPSYITKDPKYR